MIDPMNDTLVLPIPHDIAERARVIAATTEQPVEQVLLEHLKTLAVQLPILPPDEQAELDARQHLSDDALWTMAREQMPSDVEARAHTLMDKNSRGTITDDEIAELEKLVERADRLMLRKAEAAAILKARGYASTQQDFKPVLF
jgi:hypothetical protein